MNLDFEKLALAIRLARFDIAYIAEKLLKEIPTECLIAELKIPPSVDISEYLEAALKAFRESCFVISKGLKLRLPPAYWKRVIRLPLASESEARAIYRLDCTCLYRILAKKLKGYIRYGSILAHTGISAKKLETEGLGYLKAYIANLLGLWLVRFTALARLLVYRHGKHPRELIDSNIKRLRRNYGFGIRKAYAVLWLYELIKEAESEMALGILEDYVSYSRYVDFYKTLIRRFPAIGLIPLNYVYEELDLSGSPLEALRKALRPRNLFFAFWPPREAESMPHLAPRPLQWLLGITLPPVNYYGMIVNTRGLERLRKALKSKRHTANIVRVAEELGLPYDDKRVWRIALKRLAEYVTQEHPQSLRFLASAYAIEKLSRNEIYERLRKAAKAYAESVIRSPKALPRLSREFLMRLAKATKAIESFTEPLALKNLRFFQRYKRYTKLIEYISRIAYVYIIPVDHFDLDIGLRAIDLSKLARFGVTLEELKRLMALGILEPSILGGRHYEYLDDHTKTLYKSLLGLSKQLSRISRRDIEKLLMAFDDLVGSARRTFLYAEGSFAGTAYYRNWPSPRIRYPKKPAEASETYAFGSAIASIYAEEVMKALGYESINTSRELERTLGFFEAFDRATKAFRELRIYASRLTAFLRVFGHFTELPEEIKTIAKTIATIAYSLHTKHIRVPRHTVRFLEELSDPDTWESLNYSIGVEFVSIGLHEFPSDQELSMKKIRIAYSDIYPASEPIDLVILEAVGNALARAAKRKRETEREILNQLSETARRYAYGLLAALESNKDVVIGAMRVKLFYMLPAMAYLTIV